MTFLDAAEEILKSEGRPMHPDEITRLALDRGLLARDGKTPAASMRAAFIVHINKGGTRFVRTSPGHYGLGNKADVSNEGRRVSRSAQGRESDARGFVYILTNPIFRKNVVKIGKTKRAVNTRAKDLYNTAIPMRFEEYASLRTAKYEAVESLIHAILTKLTRKRVNEDREFYKIRPEEALEVFRDVATVIDDAEIVVKKKKKATRTATAKMPVAVGESWSGKTQLAKLIARRGGNEGAYGGILHYFSKVRPCVKSSKWRALLEGAGVRFDGNDFVRDWKHAKNPF